MWSITSRDILKCELEQLQTGIASHKLAAANKKDQHEYLNSLNNSTRIALQCIANTPDQQNREAADRLPLIILK
jgi:hypothetical protein